MESRGYFDSLEAYCEYLLRLDLFNRQFCRALRETQSDLLNRWRLRDHLAWLAADLAHFALAPLPADTGDCLAPRIASRASAFGAAYVVLGSSLGARFLVSRAARLQHGRDEGTLYLTSLKSSKEWPDFLRDLEAEDRLADDELLHGALQTFSSYKSHMTRTLIFAQLARH